MRADLLNVLGLSPFAEIRLKADTPFTMDKRELPDHIYDLLTRRCHKAP